MSVLDGPEAASIFAAAFGEKAKSYFDFSDDHWFVQAEKRILGRWLEAYNLNDLEAVRYLLKGVVDWASGDQVYYLAGKSTVFKVRWDGFTAWWDAFLTCENDATIVMKNPNEKEALMFTAIGDILLVVDR